MYGGTMNNSLQHHEHYDDPLNLIAAQYVLGVLTHSARARVKTRIQQERELRELVQAWERRLNPLAGMVAPEPVPEHVWQAILQKIEHARKAANDSVNNPDQGQTHRDQPTNDQPVTLTDVRYKRWKAWAGFSTAVAAVLALFIVFDPNGFVPMVHFPHEETLVQATQDIAVLSSSDKTPTWIVRQQKDTLLLTSLRADSVPTAHDLELWSIQGNQAPRSLGVLHVKEGQATLPQTALNLITQDSVLAISLEPTGGSPSGAPTGAVLYTGTIVKAAG